ncbi:MAG: NAD-dependent epimerase/dehydratase family protein [Betaproteobacteria bacterium]|nr:NAD-dependent epimerase/dehydratase family protein [Betaproteobacteria bacterium]
MTGATGVVGSAILEQLLADPEQPRVWLLVRARDSAELQRRRRELLEYCGGQDMRGVDDRVIAVAGDTTAPDFGLSGENLTRITHECSNIVHSAGVVRMNLPLEKARASAVGSTRNILALADSITIARKRAPKIEFVSTVGVGGRLKGELPEDWIDTPREFHNSYEQSKAEAESLVEQAVTRGARITVHRPSMVVGNSTTGKVVHFQVFYHLAEFLSGRRTWGICPDTGSTTLDLIPSDVVASAIIWASRTPSAEGRILHLCGGPEGAIAVSRLHSEIREAYKRHGIRLPAARVVSPRTLRFALPLVGLFVGEKNRRALGTLPVFLDYLNSAQSFGNARTRSTLRKAAIEIPEAQQFVHTMLDYYLRQKYGKPSAPRRSQ